MINQTIKIEAIPAVLYGDQADRVWLYVHGKHGCKEEGEAFARVVCPKGWQVLAVDLPEHGARRFDAAFDSSACRPRFVLSAEISSIYKKDGKTRKVHNIILLPDFETADALSHRLEQIGNLHSDGRPILGLDSRDLLEISLEVCPQAIFIPAHIWTPHFSLFGTYSGCDTIEACFEDLTPHIHALEAGLS